MQSSLLLDTDRDSLEGLPILLELAALARSREDIFNLWERVAVAIARTLAFETVVVNEYRPAWDDFQAVVAIGLSAEDRAVLLGGTVSADLLRTGVRGGRRVADAYVISGEDTDLSEFVTSSVSGKGGGQGEDAWHPEDSLFVPLMARSGQPLALLSLDNPIGGRRPDDHTLEAVSALSAVVAPVVEHAHVTAREGRHRRAVEHLLRVSAGLRSGFGLEQMLTEVCAAIRDALDFESVAVLVEVEDEGPFDILADAGVDARMDRPIPRRALEAMLELAPEVDGCVLIEGRVGDEAAARLGVPVVHRSRNNGRGAAAWNEHWLFVPLRDRDGRLRGVSAPTTRVTT